MSTLGYARLTSARESSPKDSGTNDPVTGVSKYIDSISGLVPAEVLALHSVIVTVNTKSNAPEIADTGNEPGLLSDVFTDPAIMVYAFWALLAMTIGLYIVNRYKDWNKHDYLRMVIPAISFILWTLLQKGSAIDALNLPLSIPARLTIALIGSAAVGIAATSFASAAAQYSRNN